jgi:hypothetical protein
MVLAKQSRTEDIVRHHFLQRYLPYFMVPFFVLLAGCGDSKPTQPAAGLQINPKKAEELQLPKWTLNFEKGIKLGGKLSLAPGVEIEVDEQGQLSKWSLTVALKIGPYGIQTKVCTFTFKESKFDWIPGDTFSAELELSKYVNRTFSPKEGFDYDLVAPLFKGRGVIANVKVGGKDLVGKYLVETTCKEGVISFSPRGNDWLHSTVGSGFIAPEMNLTSLVPVKKPADKYASPFSTLVLPKPEEIPETIPKEEWGKFIPFVIEANYSESGALRWGDPRIMASFHSGKRYDHLKEWIARNEKDGIYQENYLDCSQSYPIAMRRRSNGTIEFDACEVWSSRTREKWTDKVIRSEGPKEYKQTIILQRIEKLEWRVTDVQFHHAEPPK